MASYFHCYTEPQASTVVVDVALVCFCWADFNIFNHRWHAITVRFLLLLPVCVPPWTRRVESRAIRPHCKLNFNANKQEIYVSRKHASSGLYRLCTSIITKAPQSKTAWNCRLLLVKLVFFNTLLLAPNVVEPLPSRMSRLGGIGHRPATFDYKNRRRLKTSPPLTASQSSEPTCGVYILKNCLWWFSRGKIFAWYFYDLQTKT